MFCNITKPKYEMRMGQKTCYKVEAEHEAFQEDYMFPLVINRDINELKGSWNKFLHLS